MKKILKYLREGITIEGNIKQGYTVFTPKTQYFYVSSLDELTPIKFKQMIDVQKEHEIAESLMIMKDKIW